MLVTDSFKHVKPPYFENTREKTSKVTREPKKMKLLKAYHKTFLGENVFFSMTGIKKQVLKTSKSNIKENQQQLVKKHTFRNF